MKKSLVIAAPLFALALASCGHKNKSYATADAGSATSAADLNAGGAAAPAGAGQSNGAVALPAGQAFANQAAASDAFEVATSKLALEKASQPAVKKFAQRMIDAHTASTAKLKVVSSGLSPAITPDPTLTPAQQQAETELQFKAGTDFDAAYKAAQVEAHQKTLDALKRYASSGDVPALKQFASGLIPTVTAHLNMAKSL